MLADKIINNREYLDINADEKNNPTIKKVISTSKIPSKKKVIFSTSVLSTGINLKGKQFSNVFICQELNLIEITQFIHRFRNGISKVFDFIPYTCKKSKVIDFEKKVIELTRVYQKMADALNDVYLKNIHVFKPYVERKNENLIKPSQLYFKDGAIVINENRVRLEVLTDIHVNALNNAHIRKDYLELYGIKGNVKIIVDQNKHSTNLTGINKTANKIKLELQDLALSQLISNHKKTIQFFKESNTINPSLFNSKYILSLRTYLSHKDRVQYENTFADSLGNLHVRNTMSEFLLFYGIGLSLNTSVALVKQNKFGVISKAIEFAGLLPLIRISDYELKNKFQASIFSKVKFIEQVHKFINNNKENIESDQLRQIIIKHREPKDFIEHFRKSPQKRLSYIYKFKGTTIKPDSLDLGESANKLRISKFEKLNSAAEFFAMTNVLQANQISNVWSII